MFILPFTLSTRVLMFSGFIIENWHSVWLLWDSQSTSTCITIYMHAFWSLDHLKKMHVGLFLSFDFNSVETVRFSVPKAYIIKWCVPNEDRSLLVFGTGTELFRGSLCFICYSFLLKFIHEYPAWEVLIMSESLMFPSWMSSLATCGTDRG